MGLKSGIMRISDGIFERYIKYRTSDKKKDVDFKLTWKEYIRWRGKCIKAERNKKIKDQDKDLPF